ncbi:MAG: polyprenyl synthetase family protein [Candidatus Levybacteria bacterium]|nr:polyprenyl synthetase family protein [Candidatus Levybacteria bacterium]
MNLQEFKKEFDIQLKNFLDNKIEQIKSYTKDPHVIDYLNHANLIALSGGKRVRPFIAYLSYSAFREKNSPANEETIKFLISLEIFHLFALIHDDIMDKDKLRHGISTSQFYIENELKRKGNKDSKHIGISQAILVGDLFFNWAWEIISSNNQKIVSNFFSEMVEGTISGQMLDIESKNEDLTQDLMHQINYLKTARYSFIYPLLIGASLAKNLTNDETKFLKELGLSLGIAFQTQDDIFDSDNKSQIESQNKIIKTNMENAKKLIEKSKMEKGYKEKFLEFIKTIEKRRF